MMYWAPMPFTQITQINNGGPEEDRTPDLYRAKVALSQLSYRPIGTPTRIRTETNR